MLSSLPLSRFQRAPDLAWPTNDLTFRHPASLATQFLDCSRYFKQPALDTVIAVDYFQSLLVFSKWVSIVREIRLRFKFIIVGFILGLILGSSWTILLLLVSSLPTDFLKKNDQRQAWIKETIFGAVAFIRVVGDLG